MRKNVFTYIVIVIQTLLLVCFAFVAINIMPQQWKIVNDSLNVLSPTNNKSDTIQQTTPIKSFVSSDIFSRNNINNSYITAALERLHTNFLYTQCTNNEINLDVLLISSSLFYYKVFDQNEKWSVAVFCPEGNAPRIAVMNKELIK